MGNAGMTVNTVHAVQLALNLLAKVGRQTRFHVKVLSHLSIRADRSHIGNGLLEWIVRIELDLVFDMPMNASSQPLTPAAAPCLENQISAF